jgi:lysyl-tRNA synthetase class 2
MSEKSGEQGYESEEIREESDLYETRVEKLRNLLKEGINPYERGFVRLHSIATLREAAESDYEKEYKIAGRIRSKRLMGKAGFLDLEDDSGRIQMYGAEKVLGRDYETFRHLDLGDIIGVTGTLFITKTGELTFRVGAFTLLSKCLRPLPVVKEADGRVFDAFADKEQRYRMRYVDMIVNPEVKKTFIIRSTIIAEIRNFLTSRDFLEVETPMMHPIPGGASAKPFTTHHNALGMDLYLRIAPELYLKRLLVGGMPRVFELNRNFRNEGISYKHNPEFTMLELYEAYGDMNSMMRLCEQMLSELAVKVTGGMLVPFEDHAIDLTPPWSRMTYFEAIERHSGAKLDPKMSTEDSLKVAGGAGLQDDLLKNAGSVWDVAELLFDEFVEQRLIQPVFITEYPVALSPLAKEDPNNRGFTERFETYVAGREIANAFSELNDPFDQKRRFEEQVRQREAGEGEGGYMDLDFIRALEYGMPPAGGMGIGVDRLIMLLTNNHSIRDTILFPLLRPEAE